MKDFTKTCKEVAEELRKAAAILESDNTPIVDVVDVKRALTIHSEILNIALTKEITQRMSS